MFTEEIVPAAGPRLNVASGPRNGPPLWLVHGLIRRWQDFGPLLPALAARWAVRAIDQRGHGLSDRAASYLVPDYVADTVSLLGLEEAPAVLVGHSLGALVALGAAARLPAAVRAVVMIDPPGRGFLARVNQTAYGPTWAGMRALADHPRPVAEIARALAAIQVPGPAGRPVPLGTLRDAASLRFVARCVRDLDPFALTPALDGSWFGGLDPVAEAARVHCPALLVVSDPACGGMLPPADADPLAAALADVTRVDLPGVGHLPHTQDTAATLRVLHAFLDSL
ncbi:alpha/beta hydrolase [bacterium]|nr:alpha/beta hydrolase [bacterium]